MVPPSPVAFGVWIRTPVMSRTPTITSRTSRKPRSFAIAGSVPTRAGSAGWPPAEPAIGLAYGQALGGLVALRHRGPADHVPPGAHVVGTLVLVLEIVSVLPDVDAKNRRLAVHDRAVLVGRRA